MARDGAGAMRIQLDIPEKFLNLPFHEIVQRSVYGCGRSLKSIAADLDMSSSELSRKLANRPDDPVHFPLDRLPDLIAATKDSSPIYWLVYKFLVPQEEEVQRLVRQAREFLPALKALTAAMEKVHED